LRRFGINDDDLKEFYKDNAYETVDQIEFNVHLAQLEKSYDGFELYNL
jgi:hypothetical protein